MHVCNLSSPRVLCPRPFRTSKSVKCGLHIRCSGGKGFGGEKAAPKKEKKPQNPARQPTMSESQPPSQSGPPSQPTAPPGDQRRPPAGEIQEVPEVINQRLLNRILIFSLTPVLLGFISLPLLAYIQVVLKIDLPTGTAFTVSGLFFGAGLLGITYGILSASWDENEEGTGLGFKEFKTNTAPFFDKVKEKLK